MPRVKGKYRVAAWKLMKMSHSRCHTSMGKGREFSTGRLGNSRRFAFGRVKGFRKSAFFPPLWQCPQRLCSGFFSYRFSPLNTRGSEDSSGSTGVSPCAGAPPPPQERLSPARSAAQSVGEQSRSGAGDEVLSGGFFPPWAWGKSGAEGPPTPPILAAPPGAASAGRDEKDTGPLLFGYGDNI